METAETVETQPEPAPAPASAPGPGAVREELVGTAVRFLENRQVQSSTMAAKQEFLAKKGLTEEEIVLAFNRAAPPPTTTTVPVAVPQ